MEQIYIKDVAIYLRKSRGEEDKDLEKHKSVLVEIAVSNKWRYILYEEIANSESIEGRPKFSKLIKEIEEETFDAVLVMDYDRLGRGEGGDQDAIRETFKYSKTYIVTPDRVYNLDNESDEDYSKFKGFFANFEYTQIKRRLKRGKKIGAKLGHWTNGTPPFPYIYEPQRKGLVVNEKYQEIYNEMKRMFFEGVTFKKLAWYLNGKEVPSPRGSVWHENAVRRTLIDETHIGRIISGKQKGSGHKSKNGVPLTEKQRKKNTLVKLPRSEWTIVENCHEALKTQQEHDEILLFLKKRKIIPDVVTKGIYLLSGLVFCAKCKKAILLQKRNNENTVTKGCQYYDPYGIKCYNKGVVSSLLEDALTMKLIEYENDLLALSASNVDAEIRISNVINEKVSEIDKASQSIERVKEMYEDGEYTKEEYQKRLNSRKEKLSDLENELYDLKRELSHISQTSNEQRVRRIKDFRKLMESSTDLKLLNTELRKIVSRIEYKRESKDSIDIEVSFH